MTVGWWIYLSHMEMCVGLTGYYEAVVTLPLVLGLHFFRFTLSALDLHLSWVTLRAHSRAA